MDNVRIEEQISDVSKGRSKTIGGSDISAILGISPFKSRYQLLLEKSEIKEKDFIGNKYTDYGIELEPKIREHIAEQYGMNFIETTAYTDIYRYNCDGTSDEYVLEIKTTSQIKENLIDYKPYMVQLLLGMKLHNKSGILAVYHRPDDMDKTFDDRRLTLFHMKIEDYQDWWEEIEKEVNLFLDHLSQVNSTYLFEGKVLPEEHFIPNDIVEIGNQIQIFEQQIQMFKELEKRKKTYMSKIKKLMEQENIKTFELVTGTKITLVEDGHDDFVEKVDTKLMVKENPELAKKYTSVELKKGKKGYVRISLPKKKKGE